MWEMCGGVFFVCFIFFSGFGLRLGFFSRYEHKYTVCLVGVVAKLQGRSAVQRELERLEKWFDRNLMQLSKGKCRVLHLGRNNPMHRLGLTGWETALQRRI